MEGTTATTTRHVARDATELWNHESRDFLDYVQTVASPVSTEDVDTGVLEALREAWEEEQPLIQELYGLLMRLGLHADRPAYGLHAAHYNFVRGEVLGRAYLGLARQDVARMRELHGRYRDAATLEERLLRQLLEDWIGLRDQSASGVEKLLAEAEKARAAAAGEAVDEEEEEAPAVAEGEHPWHNEDLPLEERMKLAEGRGLFEKLFAAMAQTDCTACGYDCEGYARAIAEGEDDDLTKCAPGEQETQEMLEKLIGKR